jgi:hypothetical protein
MHCCGTGGDPAHSARTWSRRAGAFFQWALPLAALALIPKCPACVAAYVLLFTGLGLSFPAAAAVRWALIASCVAALLFLLVRFVVRVARHMPAAGHR